MSTQKSTKRLRKFAKQEKNKCGYKRICEKIEKTSKTKKGLNSTFLESVLNCSPDFIGCFAENELEKLSLGSLPCYLIVNLDSAEMPGSHWIAIGVFQDSLEIFDSLGFNVLNWPRVPNCLLRFLHRLSLFRSVQCSKRLQPDESVLCGFYTLLYIKYRPFFAFHFLENLFSVDLEQNDCTLTFIFNKQESNYSAYTFMYKISIASENHSV